MRGFICAGILLLLIGPMGVQAGVSQAAGACRLSQLREMSSMPEQLDVYVEAGEQLPLTLVVGGAVVSGQASMQLQFSRPLYIRLRGKSDPLFSWNGSDWDTGARLFSGLITAQIGQQGGEIRCQLNER